MAATQRRYFAIGLFVLMGLAVAITLLILISANNLFSKTIYIETYFNESVQGLSVGSYVKYRGIEIGRVKDIAFAEQYYPQAKAHNKTSRYIYVLLAINSSFLTSIASDHVKKQVSQQVDEGLRAKLNMQDLTGSSYVEFTYVDSPNQNHTALPIYWEPQYAYVPSTASTFNRFADSIQSILNGLEDVDFKRFFEQGESTMKHTNSLVRHLNEQLSNNQQQITSTVQNLRVTSSNLRQLVNDLQQAPGRALLKQPHELPFKKQYN